MKIPKKDLLQLIEKLRKDDPKKYQEILKLYEEDLRDVGYLEKGRSD